MQILSRILIAGDEWLFSWGCIFYHIHLSVPRHISHMRAFAIEIVDSIDYSLQYWLEYAPHFLTGRDNHAQWYLNFFKTLRAFRLVPSSLIFLQNSQHPVNLKISYSDYAYTNFKMGRELLTNWRVDIITALQNVFTVTLHLIGWGIVIRTIFCFNFNFK